MTKYFSEKFNSQYGINPLNHPKAKLRILDAIERMRKVLSANMESSINIECLLEDEDMNYTLKREEFENLIKDSIHQIQDTLNSLKDLLVKKGIKYSDVEIIGGGSRIPIVQQMIMDTFKVDQVMRTMNASECIARGCALMSAMLSPLFKVAPYAVEEYNLYPVRVNYSQINADKMEIENEKQEKSSILFPEACNLPSIKSISFNKPD